MDSYRLTINNYDLSTSNIEQAEEISGFTVVKAPKGPITPVRVSSAGTARIQDIFGVASADYPELYEALTFNTEYDTYISAPYTKAQVPVAYITAEGIYPAEDLVDYNTSVEDFVNGTEDTISDFIPSSANVLIDSRYPITSFGVTNHIGETYSDLYDKQSYPGTSEDDAILIETGLLFGELSDFTATLGTGTFKLKNLPIKLGDNDYANLGFVNNTSVINITWVSGSTTYNVGYLVDSEGNTLTSTTAASEACVLKITGYNNTSSITDILDTAYVKSLLSEALLKKIQTFWVKGTTSAAIKGVIFPKYPSTRKLYISFASYNAARGYDSQTAEGRNTLKMTAYETEAFHNVSHPIDIVGSLDITAKDANGANIGFSNNNTSYMEQDLVCIYSVNNEGFADDTKFKEISKHPSIILEGGIREYNVLDTDGNVTSTYNSESFHNLGWAYAQNEDYSSVRIFFDSYPYETAPVASSNYFFTLSEYHPLAGYIYNYTVAPTSAPKSGSILAYGENYWNICNEAIINLSNNYKIISSMTGARALMQCRIIENSYGGIAPMFLNSGSPSQGGQLTLPGLFKLRYKYTSAQQKILDELNFNPVIQDHSYGVMVVGQKTGKSGAITDRSYIGHVCAFLDFQRDVREQVMMEQLGKANSPYYRDLRREQVLNLLERRTTGDGRIWAEGTVDTSTADGVNDIYAQKARKFVIIVKVKVDVFSEYVELNFTNVDQSTVL